MFYSHPNIGWCERHGAHIIIGSVKAALADDPHPSGIANYEH